MPIQVRLLAVLGTSPATLQAVAQWGARAGCRDKLSPPRKPPRRQQEGRRADQGQM